MTIDHKNPVHGSREQFQAKFNDALQRIGYDPSVSDSYSGIVKILRHVSKALLSGLEGDQLPKLELHGYTVSGFRQYKVFATPGPVWHPCIELAHPDFPVAKISGNVDDVATCLVARIRNLKKQAASAA